MCVSYDVNRAPREAGLATYPDVEAPVSKVVEASAGETRVDNEGSGLSGTTILTGADTDTATSTMRIRRTKRM
jgi:hypothetical protein